jgi:putative NADH-flavin reductase
MKKILTKLIRSMISLTFIMLLASTVFAQIPEKMSYQAVVRDAANKLVVSKSVGIQINILQGSVTGAVVYTETQKATTNINGLVTLEIGGGAGFATIDWTAGPFFIQTKIDPVGGTNYTITGTSQILSVPFALAASTAYKLTGPLNEKDPVFTAWDKSTGISIKENQISDLKHFTTADETDPIFKKWNKSDGISITESQITDLKHFTNANETDPIFSVWNKSTGILIKENQITDLKHFTTADEKDPIFKAWDKSTGIVIKENQISDLKHFTTADEKDPIFGASVAKKITKEDTVRWNQDTDPENELQWIYKTDDSKIGITDGGYVRMNLQDAYYNGDSIHTLLQNEYGEHGPVVINGKATGAAIKLIDTHQGLNKVLISDANGLAHWDSVTTNNIKNLTIINDDLSNSAEIRVNKLHEGGQGSILVTTGTNPVWSAPFGDVLVELDGLGNAVTAIQKDSVSTREIRDLTILNKDVNDTAEIRVSKLHEGGQGSILVTTGTNPVWSAPFGDVLVELDGLGNAVTAIQKDSVSTREIRDLTILNEDVSDTANIAISKLEPLDSAFIFVGSNLAVPTAVAMSGDVLIDNLGVTTIQTNAVTVGKIADATNPNQVLTTELGNTNPAWSDNLDLPGTLDVTGAVVFDNSLTVNGSPTTLTQSLRINEAVNGESLIHMGSGASGEGYIKTRSADGTKDIVTLGSTNAGTLGTVAVGSDDGVANWRAAMAYLDPATVGPTSPLVGNWLVGTGDLVNGQGAYMLYNPTSGPNQVRIAVANGDLAAPPFTVDNEGDIKSGTVNGNTITAGTGTLTLNSSTLSVSAGNLALVANPSGSTLTLGAGPSSVSGSNTGDQDISGIATNATAIGHLQTLSGVAGGSNNLGTFTGSTISDNNTVKGAFQDLETAVEAVSPASSIFGFVYELATIADATIAGGTDIVFSDNGPLSGITHSALSTQVTIPSAGIYKIEYSVSISAGAGAMICIYINGGTPVPSTNKTFLTAPGSLIGTTLVSLAAGDVIAIKNNSMTPFSLDLTPSVGAQLMIQKIK